MEAKRFRVLPLLRQVKLQATHPGPKARNTAAEKRTAIWRTNTITFLLHPISYDNNARGGKKLIWCRKMLNLKKKKPLINLAKIASDVGLNIEEGKRLQCKY